MRVARPRKGAPTRVRVGWASGILGALLVTACTTGGTPGTTPTAPTTTSASITGASPTSATTSTSSTSSTGSATTGDIPAAARVDSVDGSVEFVKFLVTEVNRAYGTPRAAILDAYFTPGCVGCQDLRGHVAKMEGLGQRTAADTWSVTRATPNTWSVGSATVVLAIHQKRVDFIDSQGRPVTSMADRDQDFFLTLAFDSTWRVVRWQKA